LESGTAQIIIFSLPQPRNIGREPALSDGVAIQEEDFIDRNVAKAGPRP
jgi:hypothetical protein